MARFQLLFTEQMAVGTVPRTYNLDHEPIAQCPPVHMKPCPPKEVVELYMDIYFSTIHVAYPFLRKDEYYSLLPELLQGNSTLTSARKSTFCMSVRFLY